MPDVGFEYFRVLKKALQSCSSETARKPFEVLFQSVATTVIQLALRQYNKLSAAHNSS